MAIPPFTTGWSSYPSQQTNQVAVVSPLFCAPYPVDLRIVKKLTILSRGRFNVTDVNGKVMFKIKGSVFNFRDRRVLVDAAGRPIISFQQKILTAHSRWQVYRGVSSSSRDLLFSVKRSSLFQFKTRLNVFLAANVKEDVPDFKIKGSWFERSCSIYLADTSTIIAEMHKQHSLESFVLGKDTLGVTVYPNIDYAFIVALVAILYEINETSSSA